MTKKKQDFEMFAGDSKNIEIVVSDTSGDAVDLTGSTIKWALKKSASSVTDEILKTTSSGITITNPTTGTFKIVLDSVDTQDKVGRYYHAAEITDLLGNVSTIFTGVATFYKSGV